MAEASRRLIETLDQIERRVELLRQGAMSLEQERNCLVEMLEAVQNNKDLTLATEGEREEIQVNAQRLMERCVSVEVQVATPRNNLQQAALLQVNEYIEELVNRLRTDLSGSKVACRTFLNACLSDANGPIDQRFQSVIIDCAADDQKKIRKRLESLLRTIEHSEKNIIKTN